MESTLSSKGQATIPKAVRERLHLKPPALITHLCGPMRRGSILRPFHPQDLEDATFIPDLKK